MKRALLYLPMIAIALFLIANGMYAALSDYYPEPTRPFSALITLWGAILLLLLAWVWARPSRKVLRVIGSVALVPCGCILAGHLWFGMEHGWEMAASDLATTFGVGMVLAIAYFCIAQRVGVPRAVESFKPNDHVGPAR